ncbi:hypothetical protein LDENG_00010880 [Lucifuga dentata]|nr:hypothetical protein LDENG_00010880 [Lucifuga dentata]
MTHEKAQRSSKKLYKWRIRFRRRPASLTIASSIFYGAQDISFHTTWIEGGLSDRRRFSPAPSAMSQNPA